MVTRALTISIIIACSTVCLTSLPVAGQYSIKGGSLVITSSAKEGLIMVADKRSVETNGKDSTFSETTKIYPLNKYYAFTIAGKLSAKAGGFFPANFESVNVIRDFFSNNTNPVISQKLLEDLGNHLFDNYKPILDRIRIQRALSCPYGHTITKLVDVSLCGFDVKSKRYQFGTLSVFYMENYSADNGYHYKGECLWAAYSESYDAFRSSSQISIAGKTDLAFQLIRNHDERMEKFIQNKDKLNFSSAEIITFSKWLIEETSKVDKTVGVGVDVAVINENGFRWVP